MVVHDKLGNITGYIHLKKRVTKYINGGQRFSEVPEGPQILDVLQLRIAERRQIQYTRHSLQRISGIAHPGAAFLHRTECSQFGLENTDY